MKLRPIQDKVHVRRDKNEERTPGGIVIPDNAKQKVTRGVVLAVGPGKRLDNGKIREPLVKTGDKVLFGKYSGTEIREICIDGEDALVMSEDDIYGVIEED
jgi:chaperonin GroES